MEVKESIDKLTEIVTHGRPASLWPSARVQTAVIVSVIAFGLLGTALFHVLGVRLPPLLSSVFLASGVSALVYAFLGGISQDTTYLVGGSKLTGTIAALIICVVIFNPALERQARPAMSELLSPSPETWFAVDRLSGQPVDVKVLDFDELISAPASDALLHIPLGATLGEECLLVSTRSKDGAPSFSLGSLKLSDLRGGGLSVAVTSPIEPLMVTLRTPPMTTVSCLGAFPFDLVTGEYGLERSCYGLVDSTGHKLSEGSIYRRGADVVSLGDAFYMVAVVEVDHVASDTTQPYAKFALARLQPSLCLTSSLSEGL